MQLPMYHHKNGAPNHALHGVFNDNELWHYSSDQSRVRQPQRCDTTLCLFLPAHTVVHIRKGRILAAQHKLGHAKKEI